MLFLIFPTHCFLKLRPPIKLYGCLIQTAYTGVQYGVSNPTISTECPPLPSNNSGVMRYFISTNCNLALSNICDRNRSFTEDNFTHNRRTFQQNLRYFNRNITTSATINTNERVDTDNTNDSNITPSIPTNASHESNNSRTIRSNLSTTGNTNKTFNNSETINKSNREADGSNMNTSATTSNVALRRRDQGEKLKAEFQQLEECLAVGLDRTRLSTDDWLVHEAHAEALTSRHFTYDDPATGYRVMTRLCHFLRAKCCGSACRHCVFNHENVPEAMRQRLIFNSSFWVDGEPSLLQQHQNTTCGWGPLRQLHHEEVEDDDDEHDLLFKH